MKIIVPTHHHEEIKIPIIKDLMYIIDTDDINNEFNSEFYAEISKQLYIWKHQLIKDEIIGLFQRRRCLNVNLVNLKVNENEIFVAEPYFWNNKTMLEQTFFHHKFIKDNISIIKEKLGDDFKYFESVKTMYYHNMFIGTNKFFNTYSEYLFEKLSAIENELNRLNIKTNEKIGGWLAERFLTIFIFKYKINLNPCHLIQFYG